jgi:hypothetical protein
MKFLLPTLLLLSSWAVAVEGTVWYDAKGEVAVVEGPSAKPLPEPFVPESLQRELERRNRQQFHQSSIYDDWHSRGDLHYARYSRFPGGWYGCYRPVRPNCFRGSYRSTSGRFAASFNSGGCAPGARISVLIR